MEPKVGAVPSVHHHLPPRLALACCFLIAWCHIACAQPDSIDARLTLGRSRVPAGRLAVITLEGAYDRALASDQSIGIAYLQTKKNDLLRWRALTRLEPRLSGSFGRSWVEDERSRSSGASSVANTSGTEREVKNSYDSNLQPKNSVDTLQIDEHQTVDERTPVDSRWRDRRASSATILLEQPLLDLTVFPAWRAGKISAQSARLQCRFIAREVLFGVARAYYEVLRSEGVANIDRQTVALSKEQLDLAQKRFDAGDALRTDVLRAKANVESAARQLVESETAVRVARTLLGNILNLPAGTGFRVVEPDHSALQVSSVEAAASRAFVQREDYRVSALAVEQEQQVRHEVDAGYLPRVSAQVRAGRIRESEDALFESARSRSTIDDTGKSGFSTDLTTARTTPSSSFTSSRTGEEFSSRGSYHSSTETNAWEAMLVIEMPMFGRNTLDRRKATLQITQTVLQEEKVAKQIQQEVTEAWLGVESLRQTLKSLDAEVEALEQSYKDLKNQYEAGSATILDTLVALRDLNAARTLRLSQSYDYEVALRQMQRVTGDFQQQRVAGLKFR